MLRPLRNLLIVALLAAPAAAQSTQPADAGTWLDAIAARARSIDNLRAKVRYDREQVLQGDLQRRFGTLLYIAGPPAQFKVHFTTLLVDDTPRQQNEIWMFDGKWLVERDDEKKQFHKRQIVAPDADPTKIDPLALGDGPFSLPIKATREDIEQRFTVELIPADEDDPKDSIHLRLMPKHEHSEFEQIDLWYNKQSLLPIKGESIRRGSGDLDGFMLIGPVVVNGKVDEGEIDTTLPSARGQRGWHEQVTPWEQMDH